MKSENTDFSMAQTIHHIIRHYPSKEGVERIKAYDIQDKGVFNILVDGKTAMEVATQVGHDRIEGQKDYEGRSNGRAAKYLLEIGVGAFDSENYKPDANPLVEFAKQGKKETVCAIINATQGTDGEARLVETVKYLRSASSLVERKKKWGSGKTDFDSLLGDTEKEKIETLSRDYEGYFSQISSSSITRSDMLTQQQETVKSANPSQSVQNSQANSLTMTRDSEKQEVPDIFIL